MGIALGSSRRELLGTSPELQGTNNDQQFHQFITL